MLAVINDIIIMGLDSGEDVPGKGREKRRAEYGTGEKAGVESGARVRAFVFILRRNRDDS